VRFWSVCLVVFFTFALGPFPRILGRGIKVVPLPYHLIMRTPILGHLRVPSRFDIMVMLSLAVLAPVSCTRLLNRLEGETRRRLLVLGIALAIAFEYAAIPFPTIKADVPGIYRQLGGDPEPFTVLEIPLGWRDGLRQVGVFQPSSLRYQTAHGKPIVGGYISRVPEHTLAALAGRPLLRRILELQGAHQPPGGGVQGRPVRDLLDDLMALRVRYIVIDPPWTRHPVRDFIEATLPVAKVLDSDEAVAYRVTMCNGGAC
jgi:hypothetical protein